jgi:hypothetical protein
MILLSIAWIGVKLAESQNTILSHRNSFDGQARIICSDDSIGVEVTNVDAKTGRLFASRFADNPNCVKHYTSVRFIQLYFMVNYRVIERFELIFRLIIWHAE